MSAPLTTGSAIPFEVTLFAKADGPLTKRIGLAADGTVTSDGSACVMSAGEARRVRLDHVGQLAELVGRMAQNEALALGALRDDQPERVRVVTKGELAPLNGIPRPLGIIARTADFIAYRCGQPAVALVDFDQKGMPPHVAARIEALGGVWPALVSVLPALEWTGFVARRSTSAGLFHADTRQWLTGAGGLHVYLLVKDGTDVERFLKTLHERCWLAGLGWLMVGAGGQLLERALVDRTVGAAERLVFEGAPILVPPIGQDARHRQPVPRDGARLDTLAAMPPLTAIEETRLRELRAKEAQRLAPDAAKARAIFVVRQSRRLAERTGLPLAEAERVIARQCDGILLPSVMLPFDDPGLAGATVAHVLADPARFEGATLSDPLEGVEYGTCKAKIMLAADGTPWIHSFAHGRTIYRLKLDFRAAAAALGRAEKGEAVETFVRLVLSGDLGADEVEQLRDIAAARAEVGKRAVDARLTTARKKQAATEAQAAIAASDALVLSIAAPLESAREMIRGRYLRGDARIIHHHQSAFFTWTGTHYTEAEPEEVRAHIYGFLDRARRVTDEGKLAPFNPDKAKVANVLEALAAAAQLDGSIRAPAWLDGRAQPPASDVLACANGLLHLPTRELMPHDPAFFGLNAVEYAYDPAAGTAVEWLKFLKSIWPDDQELIDTLQELFGLLLTADKSHHKAFLLIGPPRSGRGTIARILTALLGKENVAGPTLSSLSQNFGLSALIGKPLAIVSDARLGGRADVHTIVERLLAITGDDSLSVDRKFRDPWTGPLPTRFMILTNELPKLQDVSGALASRFIVLLMVESFLGREDLALTQKLLPELPAILLWAMAGRDRLAERGHFVQPASAGQAVAELMDLTSPVGAFLRDRCLVGAAYSVERTTLYNAWAAWCIEHHRDHPGTVESFGRDLRAMVPGLVTTQPRTDQGGRARYYQGVGLGLEMEKELAEDLLLALEAPSATLEAASPPGALAFA